MYRLQGYKQEPLATFSVTEEALKEAALGLTTKALLELAYNRFLISNNLPEDSYIENNCWKSKQDLLTSHVSSIAMTIREATEREIKIAVKLKELIKVVET